MVFLSFSICIDLFSTEEKFDRWRQIVTMYLKLWKTKMSNQNNSKKDFFMNPAKNICHREFLSPFFHSSFLFEVRWVFIFRYLYLAAYHYVWFPISVSHIMSWLAVTSDVRYCKMSLINMLRDSELEIKHGDPNVNLIVKFFCHSPIFLKFKLWWNICKIYSEMQKYTLQFLGLKWWLVRGRTWKFPSFSHLKYFL